MQVVGVERVMLLVAQVVLVVERQVRLELEMLQTQLQTQVAVVVGVVILTSLLQPVQAVLASSSSVTPISLDQPTLPVPLRLQMLAASGYIDLPAPAQLHSEVRHGTLCSIR
jgi:hypothetical protein